MSDRALTQLSAARQALAECKTVMQAKQVADRAEAARVFMQRNTESAELVNEAMEIRLMAEKQMGEFMANSPTAQGRRSDLVVTDDQVKAPTLKEMGISKDESARAKKLAAIPAEEFQRRIEAGKAAGKLTIAAVVNPPAQEVVYDASTDEEQVEVLAPDKPTRRTNHKVVRGLRVFANAKEQMLTINDDDGEFIEAHQALIAFCQDRIDNHNKR